MAGHPELAAPFVTIQHERQAVFQWKLVYRRCRRILQAGWLTTISQRRRNLAFEIVKHIPKSTMGLFTQTDLMDVLGYHATKANNHGQLHLDNSRSPDRFHLAQTVPPVNTFQVFSGCCPVPWQNWFDVMPERALLQQVHEHNGMRPVVPCCSIFCIAIE